LLRDDTVSKVVIEFTLHLLSDCPRSAMALIGKWAGPHPTRGFKIKWRETMNISLSSSPVGFVHSSVHNIEVGKACLRESMRVLREVREEPGVVVKEWRERQLFRTEVSRLLSVAPHLIADIGLTLDEASEEVARPFWRA
jgi:uncharacterized protein YjiS (DUF1127 family)